MAEQKLRSSAGGGRVLVVDDSRVIRALVGGILRTAGYTVDEAADGRDALTKLDAAGYDALVTDLKMPGLNGFGVLEAVKNRGLGTEVIILTGTHAKDVECAVLALRLGAHDFLAKQSGPTEVIITVDRAVEKKRLREANQQLMRELEGLSRTDALTGLLNRRVFEESLRSEAGRAQRYDLTLALLIADLDHFKRVNDTHGHPAGDAVLGEFARRAQEALRDSDTVYRYGGEEFAVLLPHTDLEGAMVAARRLAACMAERPVAWGVHAIPVTVSVGVAAAQGAAADRDCLLADADQALYQAKRSGRNRAACLGAATAQPARVLTSAAWGR